MFFDFKDILQHFKFVNWRIRFLMSRTGYMLIKDFWYHQICCFHENKTQALNLACLFITRWYRWELIIIETDKHAIISREQHQKLKKINWILSEIKLLFENLNFLDFYVINVKKCFFSLQQCFYLVYLLTFFRSTYPP